MLGEFQKFSLIWFEFVAGDSQLKTMILFNDILKKRTTKDMNCVTLLLPLSHDRLDWCTLGRQDLRVKGVFFVSFCIFCQQFLLHPIASQAAVGSLCWRSAWPGASCAWPCRPLSGHVTRSRSQRHTEQRAPDQ